MALLWLAEPRADTGYLLRVNPPSRVFVARAGGQELTSVVLTQRLPACGCGSHALSGPGHAGSKGLKMGLPSSWQRCPRPVQSDREEGG